MIRYAMMCLALVAITGCGSNGAKWNAPFQKKATAAKSPAQADYFELKKDGATYILGSSASREAFTNGQMPPLKQTTFDNGKNAFVENSSYSEYNRLVAEYKKSKGL